MLRTRLLLAVVFILALLGAQPARDDARAAQPPSGQGSFEFVDQQGNADKPLTVWYYAAKKLRANSPLVFVMHGRGRNASTYRDQWVDHAERHKFLLIVPEFSEAAYPDDAYSCGNMFDDRGQAIEPAKWAFTAIEHLFDHVKQRFGNTSERYSIYGHSAGGQFVHRFALFLPEARYERAVAANPGWYTMPDTMTNFPYGLKNTTATDATLKQSFANRFILLLGDKDVKRDDENLRKTPEADAQGLHRFARGHTYFQAARQKAAELNTPFAWKRQTVPGAGHSNKQMSQAAASVLLGR